MEALTAVSVACLTIYDMVKAVERGMRIEGIRLVEKRGGKSGDIYRGSVPKACARGEHGVLLPVADALARVLEGVEPLPREHVAADRSRRPRAGRGSRGAAHPAAGRRVGDGRLRGARRRRRERAGAR